MTKLEFKGMKERFKEEGGNEEFALTFLLFVTASKQASRNEISLEALPSFEEVANSFHSTQQGRVREKGVRVQKTQGKVVHARSR